MKMSWEEAVSWLKNQPDQVELIRACFFDDPLIEAADRYFRSTEWEAVRTLIGKGPGDALEIGAGRGIASYALARDGWKTTALEPDPGTVTGAAAIRQLAENAKIDIRIERNWGESLPFGDRSFDVVFCRAVLHHAADLRKLCREVHRVLKPRGKFLAVREHVISSRADLPQFLDAHPLHRLYEGENAYLLEEYVSAIRLAGLTLVRVMNPYETDINLYPSTRRELKERIAKKIRFVRATHIPNAVLKFIGDRDRTPGRLYSFLSERP